MIEIPLSQSGRSAEFAKGALRREYTEAERMERGLDAWQDDPEMFIADLISRLRMLEGAVCQLQAALLKSEFA